MIDVSDPDPLPEQTFFADPVLDRLFGVVFRLSAELHLLRDKVQVMEQVLQQKGALRPGEISAFEPTPIQAEAFRRERKAYVDYVLSPVLGHQAAKGGQE